MTPSPTDTLQIIQSRLDHSIPVKQIIEELIPFTLSDAMTWGRRLPFWDEFRGQHSGQAIALARVVSGRTMHEFDLAFDENGRVVEGKELRPRPTNEIPDKVFTIQIGDEAVEVRYTKHYLPVFRKDLFYFLGEELSPPDPRPGCFLNRKPNALSPSGYWSQYAPHDAVEACGGPESFVAIYIEAKLHGKEKEFETLFKGDRPSTKSQRKRPMRRRPSKAEEPVIGEHTEAVAEERQEVPEPDTSKAPLRQKELFS